MLWVFLERERERERERLSSREPFADDFEDRWWWWCCCCFCRRRKRGQNPTFERGKKRDVVESIQ